MALAYGSLYTAVNGIVFVLALLRLFVEHPHHILSIKQSATMTHFTFLLLVLPSTVLGASFKAFKNSKCNDPLTITSGNQTLPNNEILIDTAISDWNSTNGPAGHWYNKMGFVNATTSGTIAGTGANNVYWKVGDADPQCTYALMKQTHGPDEGWRILTPLPGQVTLMTQDEGCYYSSVNVS